MGLLGIFGEIHPPRCIVPGALPISLAFTLVTPVALPIAFSFPVSLISLAALATLPTLANSSGLVLVLSQGSRLSISKGLFLLRRETDLRVPIGADTPVGITVSVATHLRYLGTVVVLQPMNGNNV